MSASIRVLLIDDEKIFVESLTKVLKKRGMEVQAAFDGLSALKLLSVEEPDVIVLDLRMPGMDGLETYKRVVEINPHQKAIIVSGFSETERVRKAQKLGAGAYIKKPYLMEKIGLAIRNELSKPP